MWVWAVGTTGESVIALAFLFAVCQEGEAGMVKRCEVPLNCCFKNGFNDL